MNSQANDRSSKTYMLNKSNGCMNNLTASIIFSGFYSFLPYFTDFSITKMVKLRVDKLNLVHVGMLPKHVSTKQQTFLLQVDAKILKRSACVYVASEFDFSFPLFDVKGMETG